MADPLTALMYAVQVMNFLKTLIEKTLRERGDPVIEPASVPHMGPSDDENEDQSFPQVHHENPAESNEETIRAFVVEDPGSETNQVHKYSTTDEDYHSYSTSTEESDRSGSCPREARVMNGCRNYFEEKKTSKTGQSNDPDQRSSGSRIDGVDDVATKTDSMSRGISNLSRINSITERCEAWR